MGGKLSNENGSLFKADMEHSFLYTIEEIFGNKANISKIRNSKYLFSLLNHTSH